MNKTAFYPTKPCFIHPPSIYLFHLSKNSFSNNLMTWTLSNNTTLPNFACLFFRKKFLCIPVLIFWAADGTRVTQMQRGLVSEKVAAKTAEPAWVLQRLMTCHAGLGWQLVECQSEWPRIWTWLHENWSLLRWHAAKRDPEHPELTQRAVKQVVIHCETPVSQSDTGLVQYASWLLQLSL